MIALRYDIVRNLTEVVELDPAIPFHCKVLPDRPEDLEPGLPAFLRFDKAGSAIVRFPSLDHEKRMLAEFGTARKSESD
jgi:hypothetical protein